MDTSEQYIKMCNCPEIQELARWDTDTGDVEVDPKEPVGSARYYCPSCESEFGGGYLNHIWLPQQHQIQEMIPLKSEYERICDKLYRFVNWVEEYAPYETSSCSMEQLWLAFYVKETYNKAWDGDKWT